MNGFFYIGTPKLVMKECSDAPVQKTRRKKPNGGIEGLQPTGCRAEVAEAVERARDLPLQARRFKNADLCD